MLERMPSTWTVPSPETRGCHANEDQLQKRLRRIDGHARHRVMGAEGEAQIARTDELMAAAGRLMRRG